MNLQIKSGTNVMHGSAFEFLRNSKFDENNYFNDLAGRPKPDFSQHQYGGTIGGPIRKDKTFFFFDYQGYRVKQGATLVELPMVEFAQAAAVNPRGALASAAWRAARASTIR